jgi:hypothetical protein
MATLRPIASLCASRCRLSLPPPLCRLFPAIPTVTPLWRPSCVFLSAAFLCRISLSAFLYPSPVVAILRRVPPRTFLSFSRSAPFVAIYVASPCLSSWNFSRFWLEYPGIKTVSPQIQIPIDKPLKKFGSANSQRPDSKFQRPASGCGDSPCSRYHDQWQMFVHLATVYNNRAVS